MARKLIKAICTVCDKIIYRTLDDLNKNKLGACCSKECTAILVSAYRKYAWESGIMDASIEKQKATRKLNWSLGKYKNWTEGKSKLTDPRILEISKKIAKTLTGRYVGDKNPFYGKHHTVESIEKRRQSILNNTKITKYGICPTKPEKALIEYINKNNLPYKYTGNGKFWIEDINPDFVNVNGEKKAIEVQGCYWHNCPTCFYSSGKGFKYNKENDLKKERIYKKYGWDVIYIWEHDIKSNSFILN